MADKTTQTKVNAKDGIPAQGFAQMAVILLGLVAAVQVADPVVSSLALVKASSELNFTASVQSLAAGISTLALAATAIFGGLLADKFGRRWLLFLSLFVAAAGELITAFSVDPTMYLLGRVVAGVALGVTFGASYGMLRNVSAEKSLGPAMALFNVMSGIVPVVVMVLTGVLLSVNWRLAYIVLPIFSLIIVWFIPAILPKVPKVQSGKIDWWGLLCVAVGITGILYGISMASGGMDKPDFYLPVIIGVVALILFGIRQKMSAKAFFPIKLLRHPAFLGAVLMGTFWNLMNASMGQMLPNIWQYVTHIKPSLLGAAQLPISLIGILGSIAAGMALGKGSKPRTTSAIGYCLMVVGFLSMLFITPSASYFIFIPGMVIAAFGWMMNATTQGNLFITLAPARYYGPVSSSKMMVGQFGYSLGLTGSTVMISTMTLAGVSQATNGAVSGDSNWDAITDYMADPSKTPTNAALAAVKPETLSTIYTSAFVTTSVTIAIIGAIAGTAVYLLLRMKKAAVPVEKFLGLDSSPALPASTKATSKANSKAPAKKPAKTTAKKK